MASRPPEAAGIVTKHPCSRALRATFLLESAIEAAKEASKGTGTVNKKEKKGHSWESWKNTVNSPPTAASRIRMTRRHRGHCVRRTYSRVAN